MNHSSALAEAPVAVAPPNRWAAWDRFVEARADGGFMQTSWWAEFRCDAGYEHFGAVLRSGGKILGGALVMKFSCVPGECFLYIPDGPILPPDEGAAEQIFAAVLDAVAAERARAPLPVSHLRIEPRWATLPAFVRGWQPVAPLSDGILEPRETLCVDLRPPEVEILVQMKPKGRYNIRLAQRHGVTVAEDSSAKALADFLAIYRETAARQPMSEKPDSYFEALHETLATAKTGSFFFAEHEGKRLAAAVVIFFGEKATYFYGGSLGEQRQLMAPYLLHWEIMRAAKARGCAWYDFWGISPADNPEHPWWDFSVFKRKFGGREFQLVPTLDLVYDAAAYERYVTSP